MLIVAFVFLQEGIARLFRYATTHCTTPQTQYYGGPRKKSVSRKDKLQVPALNHLNSLFPRNDTLQLTDCTHPVSNESRRGCFFLLNFGFIKQKWVTFFSCTFCYVFCVPSLFVRHIIGVCWLNRSDTDIQSTHPSTRKRRTETRPRTFNFRDPNLLR